MMNIEWKDANYGIGTTKSGLRASISAIFQTTGRKPYFTVYIEGDKRNAATRATLEKVQQILQSR